MQPLDFWYTRRRGSDTEPSLISVAFGNGTFVAVSPPNSHDPYYPSEVVGKCTIVTSTDGLTWASFSLPSFWARPLEGITDVAFGNNVFIVSVHAYDTNRDLPVPRFYVSRDGWTWSCHTAPWTIHTPKLAFGAGRFVAVGYSGVLVSEDKGETWKFESVVGPAGGQHYHLQDVTYGFTPQGEEIFVAVGGMTPAGDPLRPDPCDYTQACIATSVGSAWYGKVLPAPKTLVGVAYGNNRFVAIGRHEILHSNDSLVWETSQFEPACNLNAITFGGGRFLAVADQGYIYESIDGDQWSRHLVSEGKDLYSATFASDTFLVVGEHGSIFQSAPMDAKFLTVEVFGPGAVGINPPDLVCGNTTVLPYHSGERVQLHAIAQVETVPPEPPEFEPPDDVRPPRPSRPARIQRQYGALEIPIIFEGWTGNVQGNDPECMVVMDADKLVQASFSLPAFKKPNVPAMLHEPLKSPARRQ